MNPEPVVDEDYASEEDSDFAPEPAQQDRDSSAESDDDADTPEQRPDGKRKRQPDDAADDAGFENSGDEAVIEKGKRRRKRAKGRDGDELDEGGEGGLIKTRSQRAQEKVERKAAAPSGPVTINVDALWAEMTTSSTPPSKTTTSQETTFGNQDSPVAKKGPAATAGGPSPKDGDAKGAQGAQGGMIKIKRRYNFAGKVHTEEKLVPRDSAEAKLYLESMGENVDPEEEEPPPRRMPRRAYRSVFEPIVDQSPQRTDLNLGMSVRLKARELAQGDAKKLNTVEKSRMDWAGFVDKEGIKDELTLAGKSKDSFAERQQFLARSEARREEDARTLRLAGRS